MQLKKSCRAFVSSRSIVRVPAFEGSSSVFSPEHRNDHDISGQASDKKSPVPVD